MNYYFWCQIRCLETQDVSYFSLFVMWYGFGIVNPLSWISYAMPIEKSCLISMPFLSTYIDERKVFPGCSWILIGQFKFPTRQPYARVAADAVLGKSNMAADENFTRRDKEISLLLHVVIDYKAGKAEDEDRKQYQFDVHPCSGFNRRPWQVDTTRWQVEVTNGDDRDEKMNILSTTGFDVIEIELKLKTWELLDFARQKHILRRTVARA